MRKYTRWSDYNGGRILTIVMIDTVNTVVTRTFTPDDNVVTRNGKFSHEWRCDFEQSSEIIKVVEDQEMLAQKYIDNILHKIPEEQSLLDLGFSLSPDSTTI